MHDIDTALLRSFVHLADTRSFSRTGERVGRSQSTISTQIRKLEDLVGRPLFLRDKRNVHLTSDGETLLSYARQMVQMADGLSDRLRAPEIAGEVRFGAPEDFTTRYLPEILGAFAQAFPRVHLHVNCDLTLRLIRALEDDLYDLIVTKQDPQHLHTGSQSVWRERLVWVGGTARRFEALAVGAERPLTLVLSPPPCVYRQRATSALDAAGVAWDVAFSSPSFAGTIAAVRAGLGVSVLPRTMVPEGLVALDDAAGWPALPDAEICLIAGRRPSAATVALAGFIREKVPAYR